MTGQSVVPGDIIYAWYGRAGFAVFLVIETSANKVRTLHLRLDDCGGLSKLAVFSRTFAFAPDNFLDEGDLLITGYLQKLVSS